MKGAAVGSLGGKCPSAETVVTLQQEALMDKRGTVGRLHLVYRLCQGWGHDGKVEIKG